MKKYLVIDTETSGLFDFAQPADAPGQPRLATIAMIILDEELKSVAETGYIIKPDGWEMSEAVTKINGLTTEHLTKHGRPIREVLAIYSGFVLAGAIVVAFNSQFDTKMVRGELRRAGLPDLFTVTPNICVMRAATPICKVPKKSGGGYKFPKLGEACAHFGIEQPAAHSALGDARSAAEIMRRLHALKALPEPEVHFAKDRPAPTPAPAP